MLQFQISLLKPEIEKIDTSKYKGQEGDIIKVEAYDRYKVASVIVMIINALGLQIRDGPAVQKPSGEWVLQGIGTEPGLERKPRSSKGQ